MWGRGGPSSYLRTSPTESRAWAPSYRPAPSSSSTWSSSTSNDYHLFEMIIIIRIYWIYNLRLHSDFYEYFQYLKWSPLKYILYPDFRYIILLLNVYCRQCRVCNDCMFGTLLYASVTSYKEMIKLSSSLCM